VRHAQASFLAENYDELSPAGEAQSRLLGKYWATRNLRFDRVCVGPRVRHIDTVKLVREVYELGDLGFPEVQIISEFDEYPAEAVMKHGLPRLLEVDRGRENCTKPSCVLPNQRSSKPGFSVCLKL
jgi:hypothetical protein